MSPSVVYYKVLHLPAFTYIILSYTHTNEQCFCNKYTLHMTFQAVD